MPVLIEVAEESRYFLEGNLGPPAYSGLCSGARAADVRARGHDLSQVNA